jgi:predicted nucleic acid-binding protein
MNNFVSSIRSDSLPQLRGMFENEEFAKLFANIAQLNLVLDASVVLADLRWHATKRRSSEARSSLFEVLQAETIVPYAPTFLENEVQEKIPEIACRSDVSADVLFTLWLQYKPLITFIDTGGPDRDYKDPKDAPYVKLQRQLNAPVLTKDQDFRKMACPAVGHEVISVARTYSRQAAIEYTIKSGGICATVVPIGIVCGLLDCTKSLVGAFRRLPPSIQGCIVVAATIAIAHPDSRAKIVGALKATIDHASSFRDVALDELIPLVDQHVVAKQEASEALAKLVEMLETTRSPVH